MLPSVEAVFVALVSTLKTAGSREAFRSVDFDAVVVVAKTGQALGARRIGVVSAMGARSTSRIFTTASKATWKQPLQRSALTVWCLSGPHC